MFNIVCEVVLPKIRELVCLDKRSLALYRILLGWRLVNMNNSLFLTSSCLGDLFYRFQDLDGDNDFSQFLLNFAKHTTRFSIPEFQVLNNRMPEF
jgi:hypothetical protein